MSIVQNKKAFFDYTVEDRFEAGLVLEGWEVKAIRAGQAQLKEAYVIVRGGEIFLLNAHITPLKTASTHINPEPTRTRKLLLNAAEIRKLIGSRIKLNIGLAKGKRQFEKRDATREKDWKREQQRLMKQSRR